MMYGLPLVKMDGVKIAFDESMKAPESYRTFVDRSIAKVMGRFKVMGYPPDDAAITEGYK